VIVGTLLVMGLVAGCGDDGADGDGGATSSGVDGGAATPGDLGDTVVVAVSGQEICDGIPDADVGAALGLSIDGTQAYDTATPQCTYSYETLTGTRSNITIASMRGDGDLGGRAGNEAFDFVVETNRGLAGGTDFEEVDLDVGDRATRFSGEALHLGIVFVDDHLFTVIVPAADADAADVDVLMGDMAAGLG